MPTCNKTTHGTVMAAATWRVEGFNHPETAEGFALYKAMHQALDCCFCTVIFESDNEGLVKKIIDGGEPPRSYLGNIIY